MANWPLTDASRASSSGAVAATSLLTAVTGSATPHTVGPWTELVTSSAFACSGIFIYSTTIIALSTTDSSTLINIGVGASGSEVAKVSNIPMGGQATGFCLFVPLCLPAGSRISAQLQSITASRAVEMGVMLVGGGVNPPDSGRVCTTYGANTATSAATVLATPSAINTKPLTWTAITASTTSYARWLVPVIAMPPSASTTAGSGLVDIGIGASGSEQIIVADIPFVIQGSEQIRSPSVVVPRLVPAGSRLAARYQATATNAGLSIALLAVA